MSIFEKIDFSDGDLPPWVNKLVALARPMSTTMIVAIAPVGAFSVGMVATRDPVMAMKMVEVSTKFLQGIPDAGWAAIVTIAVGYSAGKSVEAVFSGRKGARDPSPQADGDYIASDPSPTLPGGVSPRRSADEDLPDYAR